LSALVYEGFLLLFYEDGARLIAKDGVVREGKNGDDR
jgi:hypothetical protein